MGLSDIAAKAAAIAMKVAGDAKVLATIHIDPVLTYDPAEDENVVSGGSLFTDIEVLEYKEEVTHRQRLRAFGKEEAAKSSLKKLLIKSVDIGNLKCSETTIVTFAGQQWTVFDVQEIPTQAVVILTLNLP